MLIEPRQAGHVSWMFPLLATFLFAASGSVSSQTDGSVLPANAQASRYGGKWECARGFERVQETCVVVKVPANAYLNSSGKGWECNRRYIKANQECKTVQVPANAHEEDERFRVRMAMQSWLPPGRRRLRGRSRAGARIPDRFILRPRLGVRPRVSHRWREMHSGESAVKRVSAARRRRLGMRARVQKARCCMRCG